MMIHPINIGASTSDRDALRFFDPTNPLHVEELRRRFELIVDARPTNPCGDDTSDLAQRVDDLEESISNLRNSLAIEQRERTRLAERLKLIKQIVDLK